MKNTKMLVLGSGKMAKAIAYDFTKQKFIDTVTIASRKRPDELIKFLKSKKVKWIRLDLKNHKSIVALMKKHDCAVSAVPYQFNFMLAKAAVDGKCSFVDLGGNNDIVKQEFGLSSKAKKAGIAIVPDAGLAPGLISNLTALGMMQIPTPQLVKLRVGGLPQHPKPPLNYMIVFSVHGLINEYIEPAVVIDNYKLKKVPGMDDLERLKFPGFGEMEAFNTSGGTSTLPQSFKGKIKKLNYKTIRYPGHAEKIRFLMDMGFTGPDYREMLEKLLKEKLSFKDKDLILLKVLVEDRKKKIEYTLVDKEQKGLTAMMRCTGFPAATIAEMIVLGEISKKGTLKHEFDIPPDILYKKIRSKGLDIKKRVWNK